MDQHEPQHTPRPRSRKRTGSKTLLVILLCFILAGALAFWYFNNSSRFAGSWLNKGGLPEATTSADKTLADKNASLQKTPGDQNADKDTAASVTIGKTPDEESPSAGHVNSIQTGGGCEEECGRIDTFYAHLDEQEYIQSYKLSQPSREHFKNLIVKLSQNPPVITRETDDLFTILKNTAHFFRIIGKQNILLIKGILDQEKDSIEEILADYYAISYDPECLKNRMGVEIPENTLYNYAGFFLNTMGGRLYLFRRDSFSRLPVSFYSIQIIDRANSEGKNSDGIDIRPAITALISEIENTGNRLKLKDTYLDALYALKEKYPSEPAAQ